MEETAMKSKNHVLTVMLLMATVLCTGSVSGPVTAQSKNPALKIGTYDSRVVVMTYARSDLFRTKMQEMSKKSEALLESKDTVRMKEGALNMISFSFNMEKCVFTSASATPIINLVKDQFPEIAKKAGVSMIVSKWDLNYSNPEIEIIDLTPQISALFDPSGTISKSAMEYGKQSPASEEEYGLGESIDMWEQFKAKYHFK